MSKAVTMDDIARAAGVSRGAVSLALRGSPKISEKRTDQIRRVAEKLGYRVNMNASRLARAASNTVGVLVSDLHNPITADILDGLAQNNDAANFDMHLATGFNSAQRERDAVNSFLAHQVKGVVLIGSLMSPEDIQDLAISVPTVVVGRQIDGLDCVYVHSELGGRLAAKHLLGLGHRNVAHISGGTGAGAERRASAFREEIQSVNGAECRTIEGDYTQSSGYAGAQALLGSSQPPTAIFAANDLMALGVLGSARAFGLRAGSDISVMGFDDIAMASSDFVSLTTISYSRTKMGATARELLLRRCATPALPSEFVELTPVLTVRESTNSFA